MPTPPYPAMNFTPAPSTDLHNFTFDELRVGQQASASRTLTLDDIQAFALVSGGVNPAHVDPEYAESTGFHGVIAHGMWADILLVPDLEAGNTLAKQLEYLAGAASCGVVLGAQVPIVLTSRADPPISRVASAALAGLMERALRPGEPSR